MAADRHAGSLADQSVSRRYEVGRAPSPTGARIHSERITGNLPTKLKASHRTGRTGKLIRFDPHLLQHADEQVRQRIVLVLIERQVLAMAKSTASEQPRQPCSVRPSY